MAFLRLTGVLLLMTFYATALATETRKLTGYCNRALNIDEGDSDNPGGKDYAIIGKHDNWSSEPKSLTIEGKGTRNIVKERHHFISRGWDFEDGSLDANVELEDGTTSQVVIDISTVS
eukprot:CAMPEP_0197828094 /NCGR_PEP_ID=MMETSP1437-20131217/4735_1 /TAXON_ID=49252 ORGANISM="Eucampia antarctica, Strain CCMP1452" /NCGR_SAMPLE_ID=MMETSP1437 /ASSEMBLY_ACC=CAM_ASM_001096 /LENGTH=117 /DNA_ID=CAMNT_0043429195 /DNA_START=80 /DNA_END=433 /DNA_ORIENTATION=+